MKYGTTRKLHITGSLLLAVLLLFGCSFGSQTQDAQLPESTDTMTVSPSEDTVAVGTLVPASDTVSIQDITPEPTEEPTPEPTAVPTPEPTPVPETFMFGGKKIKSGSTKIDGSSVNINGKSGKPKFITPEEVENLVTLCPDLEELKLDYCSMEDYAPLGRLTKLRTLQLSSCGTGKGNAVSDIGWLEGLTELRWLNLVHNNISDTSALEGLTELTYLNISDNPLTNKCLVPIGKLTKLKTLYLYSLSKITDVSPLANLTKLTYLHLGYDKKLEDVKPLTALTNLEKLRIHKTKVKDLTGFGKLTSLKKLDLSGLTLKTSTISELKKCTKLEKIVIEMGDTDTYYAVLDQLINEGHQVQFSYSWSE